MTSLRGEERTEFPQSVRKAAFARCCKSGTIPGVPQCEKCGIELKSGNIEYEHLVPDGLGGEPTLENCGVWCRSSCSKKKTHQEDRPRMAKADAVLKSAFGLQAKRHKIKSAGFRKAAPQRSASRPLSRRTVERQT
jgi:5-methylcytosine-specific restriction endonuclease McrA